MMQNVAVALIVLAAAVAVARRYAPPAWKAACAGLTARAARRLGWHGLAERLLMPPASAPADCSSGCAACSGCDLVPKARGGESVISLDRLKRRRSTSGGRS